MSDTQKATASKAAMELAAKIDADWELVPDNGFHFADTIGAQEKMLREARNDAIEQVAGTIDSALRELLEKAQAVVNGNTDAYAECVDLAALKSALEPWQPK